MDLAETLAGCSTLPALLEPAVLPVLEPAAGCPALPTLLDAAEEKKERSALAGCSALSERLGAAEAGRFMAALRKIKRYHVKTLEL